MKKILISEFSVSQVTFWFIMNYILLGWKKVCHCKLELDKDLANLNNLEKILNESCRIVSTCYCVGWMKPVFQGIFLTFFLLFLLNVSLTLYFRDETFMIKNEKSNNSLLKKLQSSSCYGCPLFLRCIMAHLG